MALTDFDREFRGLTGEPVSDWPEVKIEEGARPIDLLRPGSDEHTRVLDYLVKRIDDSEREMRRFYARWRVGEMKLQAFIDLPKWEKDLKFLNDQGKPPKVTSIVVPFSFAIVSTIVTYLLHTFTGSRPYLHVGTYKDETVEGARNMETVLQYNGDHTRLVRHLFHHFQDAVVYGVGAGRTSWVEEYEMRTRRVMKERFGFFGRSLGKSPSTIRERALTYQGNMAFTQDPFMFFPDPRVPMEEVNTRGEYCWSRTFEGKHQLMAMQSDGVLKWVDSVKAGLPHSTATGTSGADSARALLSGGEANPGAGIRMGPLSGNFLQVDQGTAKIIPRELGLGESTRPEIWQFTILNKAQIVQAEPLDADHNMHPVWVAEPYSLGYGFGHPSLMDYLGPLQDVIGWLLNSHIDNVRRVLNDVFVFDPSAVEEQDVRHQGPAKHIRLKRAAYGRDVRTIIQQLVVQDVTAQHMNDLQIFIRIGQLLSAVTDNVLGIQAEGGRKTATEIRTSTEGAVSRLAALARVISAQSIVDLTKQWSLNVQQHIDDDFYLNVLGREGQEKPIRITPEMLSGDFHYPVHDGTLPPDRIAAFDIWKEIFQGVLGDQELRQTYSVPKMFEFIAELGGAKNIEAMRIGVQQEEEIEKGVQAGNVVPIGQPGRASGPSGLVNSLGGRSPGNRALGGATS